MSYRYLDCWMQQAASDVSRLSWGLELEEVMESEEPPEAAGDPRCA